MEFITGLNTQFLNRVKMQLGHRNKLNKRLKKYHSAYMLPIFSKNLSISCFLLTDYPCILLDSQKYFHKQKFMTLIWTREKGLYLSILHLQY